MDEMDLARLLIVIGQTKLATKAMHIDIELIYSEKLWENSNLHLYPMESLIKYGHWTNSDHVFTYRVMRIHVLWYFFHGVPLFQAFFYILYLHLWNIKKWTWMLRGYLSNYFYFVCLRFQKKKKVISVGCFIMMILTTTIRSYKTMRL